MLIGSRGRRAHFEKGPSFVLSSLEAFDRLGVLESTAEAIINCRVVGDMAPMPEEVTRELERVFLKD